MTTRRADWMVLGGALALALLLRVVPLTYAHFWDETVYLQHASAELPNPTLHRTRVVRTWPVSVAVRRYPQSFVFGGPQPAEADSRIPAT